MNSPPHSEGICAYAIPIAFGVGCCVGDSKTVLWKSVSALMVKHYGKENLTRLSKDCRIGPASAVRIREAKTSVGLEIVDKIAKHFQVEPWELLVPAFDPSNRPALQPMSETERRLYEKLREVAKEIKEGSQ